MYTISLLPHTMVDMKAITNDNLFISHLVLGYQRRFSLCGFNARYHQIEPDNARMHQPFILQYDLQMNAATIFVPSHS